MMEIIKDRNKVSLVMATLFFLGIIVSAYKINSLPQSLMLSDGYQGSFYEVYTILGLTFLAGAATVWFAMGYKNEVIVYREKREETRSAEQRAEDAQKATISLDAVSRSLRQGANQKEILQSSLHAICKQLEAGQGAIYVSMTDNGIRKVELVSGYALSIGESTVINFEYGEGLIGQAAAGGKTLYVDEVPEGYIKILSGLGSASPRHLLIVPMKKNDQVNGVIEIASFTPLSEVQRKFVEESARLIAETISPN